MSQVDNKIDWCLKKAEKELAQGDKHRGLIKIKLDRELINSHIRKAEHNLKAISDFKRAGYSDWSASAAFYSIYHCFLAIIANFGYESRNQECTFALIYHLIEKEEIDLDKRIVEGVRLLKPEEKHEAPTIIEIREIEQYGVHLSLEEKTFEKLLKIAKAILDKTKEVLEG